MNRSILVFASSIVAVASVSLIACGHKGTGFNPDDEGGVDNGDATIIDFNGGEGGDATGGGRHCSGDLHSILDDNDNVIMTCPPDQGCGAMGCVPACESAVENQSSVGCDYYAVEPDAISVAQGGCFAAFIANTWGVPIKITADYNGTSINIANAARIPMGSGTITYAPLPNGQIPANQVAILFLAHNASIACPGGVTPGIMVDGAAHGTAMGHAFHFTSSAPVVAYDIYPYGGSMSYASSATLLLPSTSWGSNYVAAAPFEKDQAVSYAQPTLAVAARESGTTVTISPTAAIVGGGGVAATGKGVPHTYNLNKGDVLQFTQDAQLTGSPIQSNKPVGVWASATCLNIDVNDTACDVAHQQIAPVSALGHEYVAVRYRNRSSSEESVPWRIVGAVNGTTLKYFPKAPAMAPLTTGFGQLGQFWDPGPFVVQSQDDQHPFYISAHMTGQDHQPASGTGDPEFVNVIPSQEFLANYVFFTDPTYANTNLVLVRKDYGKGFQDVTLDCAGKVSGWKPISGSQYEYTRVDIRMNGQAQGQCDNGLHTIKSPAPFGLTVWGWDQYVSYAYPAGASVQPINTVIVPATPN
jgi:hypothetical protein